VSGRSPAKVEQPQGPLLLELQRPGGQRADPPDPPAEFGHLRPDPGLGQDPQAERQRGRADAVPLLDTQCQGDRGEIVLSEPPVTGHGGGPPGGGGRLDGAGAAGGGVLAGGCWLADGRQQAEQVPVAQHPG